VDRHRVQRPLLLIDVDGVLSLFGFPADDPPPGRLVFVDGLPHWLSEQAGMLINGLTESFEPVWCTGWEDRAPEHLPLLLGLTGTAFPFLRFGPADSERHWKLDAIDAYAGPDRALAWIDDGHDERTAHWATQRAGPTRLVTTDPAVGLTPAQAAELSSWASERGVMRAM
jgi:hypothetical protein